jgi:rsbT antagonist protein RsbS
MDKIPILKIDNILLVTFQADLYDNLASRLEVDLVNMIKKTSATGVLIDISAVSIIDSFMGRIIGNIASISRVLDAITVVVGMQPAVAVTIVELGLPMSGVLCALNVEKGIKFLQDRISDKENRMGETFDLKFNKRESPLR